MIKIIAQWASESNGRGTDWCGQTRSVGLLLESYADSVRIDRGKLFRSPRFGLKRSIGMHFAAFFLVFGEKGLNTLYGQPYHGLVSDFAGQWFIGHARDVQVGLTAMNANVVGRGAITKSFLEAADLLPPAQRFLDLGSRQNRNSSDDCDH